MPPATYKPLFNRRYLFWLMWIIAIAVVLLNATGREKPMLPLDIGWQDNPSHWRLAHPDQENTHIMALTSMPPGWSRQHRLLRANTLDTVQQWLLLDSTQQQLKAFDWNISVHSGMSTLQLIAVVQQTPSQDQLEWFFNALEHLNVNESPEQQRWVAAWQLDQRQPEQRLLAEFESWLYAENTVNPMWELLLSGPDLPMSSKQFHAVMNDTKTLANHNTLNLEGFVSQPHKLIAWEVALSENAATLAKHRVSIAAVQLALDSLPNRPDYRLIWNPLPPKSYLIVMLHDEFSVSLVDQLWADQLRTLVLDSDSDTLLVNAKEQLLSRHEAPVKSLQNALDWFEVSALLGFNTNSDTAYRETLEQLTVTELREHLDALLNPDHQLNIVLKPY